MLAETDELAQVAWLYHVGRRSQEEVSNALGISRFRVMRLLAEARERGLVRVSVEHETARTLAIADALRADWDLTEVLVAPMPAGVGLGPEGSAVARRGAGMVAAQFLTRVARGDAPLTIGVGWGWTLTEMARSLSGLRNTALRFVSLMGAMNHSSEDEPADVCTTLAELTGGRALFLPAPFVCDDEVACRMILSQRLVRETLEVASKADYSLVSVGVCGPEALLHQYGILTEADQAELAAAGAVAESTGRFFRADGALADCSLNRRSPAIPYHDLQGRDVVLLAAGLEKEAATCAVLRAGFVKRLIVDEALAARLIGKRQYRAMGGVRG